MKKSMLVYNEARDVEVMEVLDGCGLAKYTKINRVHGKGATSGTHLASQVWPGQNKILYVACDNTQVEQVVSGVTNLRKTLGKEGVKAFVMPLEQVV
jgi:nitrogen regulatory protein PII